jgi:MFS family permease
MVLPWVAERLREWQIITTAMWATALLLGLYPWLDTAWQMGVCSAVLGLFLGAVQPMVMSTLHQITPPERQGEALGLRLMTINACSVLMPILFGAMGTAFGVAGVFWVVASSVAVGSRWAWTLRPSARHE